MKACLGVLITAALLIALSIPVLSGPAGDVSVATLPNGMKVVIREGHAVNLAAVDIWVKAGSVNETPPSNGVSHFVEHMIFKATRKYGPGQIDREIEGLGAELNGGTSKDYVHFYTTVVSEFLPTTLDVLADAIMNAQFRPEDIEKERQVILDEIARTESDLSRHAFDLFLQVAFSEHPYRLPATGTRESVNGLAGDDLVAYYERYYTPANMCVVIAGDVVTSDAVALVQRAFAGFERPGQPATAPPEESPPASARLRRFRSSASDAHVVVGYRVAPASEFEEVCALDVILALLGDTYRGRISSALNAKGIRFTKVATDFTVRAYPSTFSVLVSVSPEDADEVTPVVLSELRGLGADPVPPAELAQAKRLVEGSDLFDQETFSGQARALGLYESIASCDLALKYGSTVRSVSRADVMAVAAKYFVQGNCCTAVIGPESAER